MVQSSRQARSWLGATDEESESSSSDAEGVLLSDVDCRTGARETSDLQVGCGLDPIPGLESKFRIFVTLLDEKVSLISGSSSFVIGRVVALILPRWCPAIGHAECPRIGKQRTAGVRTT
jgi:hypothetical protein